MASATTSDSFYTELMNFVFQNASAPLSGLTSFYVGLLTSGTTPSAAMAQNYSEVPTGMGYSRVQMLRSSTSAGGVSGWTFNAGNHEYSNASDLVYGVPTSNWGTIVAVGLFKTSTIGSADMMYYAGLVSNKVVAAGDGAPKILAGQLRVSRATC